jgi:hypothetical protein
MSVLLPKRRPQRLRYPPVDEQTTDYQKVGGARLIRGGRSGVTHLPRRLIT